MSILAFAVATALGSIIGETLLGISPNPQSLSTMFAAALIFPIWYPSPISKSLIAALIGSFVGFGFWTIGLLIPIESGSGMVVVAGTFRGGAFIAAIAVEYLQMRTKGKTALATHSSAPDVRV